MQFMFYYAIYVYLHRCQCNSTLLNAPKLSLKNIRHKECKTYEYYNTEGTLKIWRWFRSSYVWNISRKKHQTLPQ